MAYILEMIIRTEEGILAKTVKLADDMFEMDMIDADYEKQALIKIALEKEEQTIEI